MASSNVIIAGTTYPSVPAVTLVKSGGGTATFTDVSDTTAAAADVAQGKYFYTAAGVKTEGTASGGIPTPPITPTDAVIFYSLGPFKLRTYNGAKNWDGTLYYSTDYSTWNTWVGTNTLTAVQSGGYYKLYVRGSGNTYLTNGYNFQAGRWVLGGNGVKCCGNLNNLLSYTTAPTLQAYAFANLFYGAGSVDFDVSLPSTTLSDHCYYAMFQGCIGLSKAPVLPATTLAPYCYYNMFYECISLQTPPELPSTTLANYCYYGMFIKCYSLTVAPELPATTLASYCYSNMFNTCTSLTTPPRLPATTLAEGCYATMFSECTFTVLPLLPATNLPNYCYRYMFQVCKNIKLSTSKTGAYQTAYRIPSSGTGSAGTNSLQNMFNSTGGTFTGTPTINTTYYTSNTVIS